MAARKDEQFKSKIKQVLNLSFKKLNIKDIDYDLQFQYFQDVEDGSFLIYGITNPISNRLMH